MTENDNMVHRLTWEDKEIVLVGTAHVSKESVERVRTVIDEDRPDTVAVELCPSRHQAIRQKENWLDTDIVKVIRQRKATLLFMNLLLASFQRRIAKKLNIQPGQEMIAAMDAADEIGAGVHLADRDIRITLTRTWRALTLWGKVKLIFQLLFSFGEVDDISEEDIERLKQEDILASVLTEVGRSLPELKTILIDERDRYLAEKIRTAPGDKVVAVVGAGHLAGIRRHWGQETDLSSLESLPARSWLSSSLKWIIPGLILVLIGYGFFHGGMHAGKNMLGWWILANGVLAGVGAVAALAHPLTIVSSVLAAPLTSLNPMIAAGWVSGLVEAFSRKPRVRDFESLSEDILSFKGFWKNKVTRILLVVVFTNIGSMFGTAVAIPLMLKVL
ncbi:MAG: TraB/GumN family protein [Desulfobacterales bacterium]|nr:TraB/GumN family protein [Desulfobacterales bacterium]